MDNQKLVLAARLLLGVPFVVFGLNGFLQFMPMEALPAPAMDLMMAFMRSRYMMPLLSGSELLVGLMLVSGYYVPLALLILAPIMLNIFLFHIFLLPNPSTFVMPVIFTLLALFLARKHEKVFGPILKPRQND